MSIENDTLIFANSYFDESWYEAYLEGQRFMLSNRRLSTYINALLKVGFVIGELVEESDMEQAKRDDSAFAKKARMLPTSFVLKAKKL